MAENQQDTGRASERTLFRHPIGLANLFGVVLWERFSIYGMLTILGYYLYYSVTDGGFGLPKNGQHRRLPKQPIALVEQLFDVVTHRRTIGQCSEQ